MTIKERAIAAVAVVVAFSVGAIWILRGPQSLEDTTTKLESPPSGQIPETGTLSKLQQRPFKFPPSAVISGTQAEIPTSNEVAPLDKATADGREMYELVQRQMDNPTGDYVDDILEQFELLIDQTLGEDFPEEKRVLLRKSCRQMHREFSALEEAAENGTISELQYREGRAHALDSDATRIEEVLNDAEYERLFGMRKGVRPSEFLNLRDDSNSK